MKRTWTKERRWECSILELAFEKLCEENGYNITGYQEYNSKTQFLIEKDGVEIEYCIYHVPEVDNAKLVFNNMVRFYEVKAQVLELKQEVLNKSKPC